MSFIGSTEERLAAVRMVPFVVPGWRLHDLSALELTYLGSSDLALHRTAQSGLLSLGIEILLGDAGLFNRSGVQLLLNPWSASTDGAYTETVVAPLAIPVTQELAWVAPNHPPHAAGSAAIATLMLIDAQLRQGASVTISERQYGMNFLQEFAPHLPLGLDDGASRLHPFPTPEEIVENKRSRNSYQWFIFSSPGSRLRPWPHKVGAAVVWGDNRSWAILDSGENRPLLAEVIEKIVSRTEDAKLTGELPLTKGWFEVELPHLLPKGLTSCGLGQSSAVSFDQAIADTGDFSFRGHATVLHKIVVPLKIPDQLVVQ